MNQSPEILENEQQRSQNMESGYESRENEHIQAAEMLEEPPQNSYILGLQTLVEWVKSLLAKK